MAEAEVRIPVETPFHLADPTLPGVGRPPTGVERDETTKPPSWAAFSLDQITCSAPVSDTKLYQRGASEWVQLLLSRVEGLATFRARLIEPFVDQLE